MKKTMLWGSLAAALLFGGCKKDPHENAREELRKSVEEVREQREEVREEQKDVMEEQKDVTKEQRELAEAQGNLAKARANYITTTRERLARIDAKINELEARGEMKSKDAAITLRARRDALAGKLDQAGSRVDAEWDEFKSDLDDTFSKIEKDVDGALD